MKLPDYIKCEGDRLVVDVVPMFVAHVAALHAELQGAGFVAGVTST